MKHLKNPVNFAYGQRSKRNKNTDKNILSAKDNGEYINKNKRQIDYDVNGKIIY